MVLSLVLGFVLTCIYASFAEWFVHRVGMHTEKISKWAFKRHAIQHHAQSRSLKSFYAPLQRYEIWESSSVPLLWLAHIPLYLLVAFTVNKWAAIGCAAGAGFYITAYEVIHFFIHTPRNYWFQRTRLWHFYCEYHRYHHHRARWNYNVVCPLADYVLGTFTLQDMPVEPSAPPTVPKHTGPRSVFNQVAAQVVTGDFTPEADAKPGDG